MFHRQFSNRHSRSNFNRNNQGRRRSKNNQTKEKIQIDQYIHNPIEQRQKEQIVIKYNFDDFDIDHRLKQNINLHGYLKPTPIQDRTIPLILEGRDVVGIANTGTGKTAAFLVPLINKILKNKTEKILIIVPTRELAVQIEDEFKFFAKSLNIFSALLIGGIKINHQISDLRRNPHVIISTPGRLKDVIDRRLIDLRVFKNIVLDEVDRMLDIGFIKEIKYIISYLPHERQSLFFSATISSDVQNVISIFLKNPITISVKIEETAEGVKQDVIRIKDKEDKIRTLQSMLRQKDFKKVLIFGRTKWGVERLSRTLYRSGFLVASIHGNKNQNQRLRALTKFRQNQLQVLVATDVVARGMDIDDVTHVINFDEPQTYTDYIHRIGRTGRAQKTGKALTFVSA